jgi:hypothetical protein
MSDTPGYKTGDLVSIKYPGAMFPLDGTVLFASSNGKSLYLTFEGILEGHLGSMPVLQGDDDIYRSVVTDTPVELSPRSA